MNVRRYQKFVGRTVLAGTAAGLVWTAAAVGEPPPAGATTPVVAAAAADQPAAGWPVAVDSPQGKVVVYQPQPSAMDGDRLTGRMALSLAVAGEGEPKFGVAEFAARVATDRDARTATLDDLRVTLVRLVGLTAADQQQLANSVAAQLSGLRVSYSLDQFTASLDTMAERKAEKREFKTTPPRVVFSNEPATLVSIAGEPDLKPVTDHAGVSRVVNTPFILLRDTAGEAGGGRYYLKEGTTWAAADDLEGPWQQNAAAPAAVNAAAETLTAAPPTTGRATPPTTGPAADLSAEVSKTRVVVSTTPAELIVTDGNPTFAPVPGGLLLYATNTAGNLFVDPTGSRYYVLLSGRWYAAATLAGPWQYTAAGDLPRAFGEIPAESPKANVLPFVGGTAEARAAVLDAAVPQTAAIRRDAGAKLAVTYDGPPRFEPVAKVPGLAYAANSPQSVLAYNGTYYCCDQAVWYQSPASPTGPWAVATTVPDAIYTIPPENPLYNVTYVRVYAAEPDAVYVGYTPGYVGNYVDGPTVVYGTGYDYAGWSGSAYYPYPATYGYGAGYDPYLGLWGLGDFGGFGFDGFYGGYGRGYRGRGYGGYGDGRYRFFGPGGYVGRGNFGRGFYNGYNPGNGYNHGIGVGIGAGGFAGLNHNLYAREGNTSRNADLTGRTFRSATAMRGERNDVFAGEHGEVFQRGDAGWTQRGLGTNRAEAWSGYRGVPEAQSAYRPGTSANRYGSAFGRTGAGLERSYAARSFGFNQASRFSGGGVRGGAGGGGGGGGFHGGGGGGGGHR